MENKREIQDSSILEGECGEYFVLRDSDDLRGFVCTGGMGEGDLFFKTGFVVERDRRKVKFFGTASGIRVGWMKLGTDERFFDLLKVTVSERCE